MNYQPFFYKFLVKYSSYPAQTIDHLQNCEVTKSHYYLLRKVKRMAININYDILLKMYWQYCTNKFVLQTFHTD